MNHQDRHGEKARYWQEVTGEAVQIGSGECRNVALPLQAHPHVYPRLDTIGVVSSVLWMWGKIASLRCAVGIPQAPEGCPGRPCYESRLGRKFNIHVPRTARGGGTV